MSWNHVDPTTIRKASDTLTPDQLAVWLTKHVAGKGRRAGSLTLGITEDAWRYRLAQADRKMRHALRKDAA